MGREKCKGEYDMDVRMYMFYVAIVFCYAICIACTAFLILRAAVWPVAPFAFAVWTKYYGARCFIVYDFISHSVARPFAHLCLVPLRL